MRGNHGAPRASRLDANGSLLHQDRPSPCGTRQSEVGMRRPGAISPPPLKRQRTAHDPSHVPNAGRLSGFPRSLHLFPEPSVHHAHKDRAANASSLNRHSNPPKQSAKSHGSCKPACQVCYKNTATSYNPIITCSACATLYHDSCRRPPLGPGVDPERWRCSACMNNGKKPAKAARPVLSTTTAPTKPSVVRRISKPRNAQPFPTATPYGLSRKTTWKNETPHAPSPSCTSMADASIQTQEAHHLARRPEPQYSQRLEVPNTPTQRSSQFKIPQCSSQQHNVQASSSVSVLDPSAPVLKRTPSTAVCSVCRKQSILAPLGDTSLQCQSCRTKSHMEKMNQLEIPETPDSVIPTTLTTPTSSAAVEYSIPFAAVPNPVANSGPVSCSDPSRTTLKPTVMKLSDETSCTFTASHDNLLEPIDTTEATSATDMHPFLPPIVSGGSHIKNSTSSIHEKHFSNRELARIALACANGSRMTALQIIDWIALRFPYLQKGQGVWEKSLKAILSRKEFSGERTGTFHGARLMYGFSSAAFKAQYEREYRDYITSQLYPESPQDQHNSIARPASVVDSGYDLEKHVKGTPNLPSGVAPEKAIKSVPIRYAKSSSREASESVPSPRNFAATPAVPDPSFVASPASISSSDSPLLNPFKSSRIPYVRGTTNHTHGTKHEASIYGIYPRDMKPSIETMSQKEKTAKVAEIRARPSRKQIFNSNQRLAHVRRYRRQDIHDESDDGAWRPHIVEVKLKRSTCRDDTITDGCDANQSLRKIFNLPANAIPMNDGNELAFRDGTLAYGRLPRPRHIYRVGKRLGTGLTIK